MHFDQLADQVFNRKVTLLNVLGGPMRHGDGGFTEFEHSAALAHESDAGHPNFLGLLDRQDNIFRISAGTDGEEDVFRLSESLNLASKDSVVSVVVRVGGEKRAVSRERKGRKAGSFASGVQSAREFRRHMLTVGGAAPVSAEQELAALTKT